MEESDNDTNDSAALQEADATAKSQNRSRRLSKKWTLMEARLMVEMMRDREALWNSNSTLYKNLDLRKHCWAEIAEKTNHSVSDAKIYWNTIKSRYNSERRKIQARKTHKPSFVLYSELEFLESIAIRVKRSKLKVPPLVLINKAELSDTIDDLPSMSAVWLESNDSNSEVKAIENDCETTTSNSDVRKHKRLPSRSPSPIRNYGANSARMAEYFGSLTGPAETGAQDRWKRVFTEYIYYELDRYDYQDAQELKNQLTMVCVNFATGTLDSLAARRIINNSNLN